MPVKTERKERPSKVQELEKPEFKSTIPPHLVDKLTLEGKWIVESLSRMESIYQWLINAVLDGNRHDIDADLRVQELEDWKAMVSSKWAVVGGFLLMCLPTIIEKLATKILH